MKKSLVIITLVLLSLFLLSGCRTVFTPEGRLYSAAKKSARQNQFDHALVKVVEALSIDPEYQKALDFLKENYYRGIEHYEMTIRNHSDLYDTTDLDVRADSYLSLTTMMDAVKKLPPLIDTETGAPVTLSLRDYSRELSEALDRAAEAHYREGLRYSSLTGRENAKAASKEFLKTLSYLPGYKDAVQREAEAREQAMQRLVILPFVTGRNMYYGVDVPGIIGGAVEASLLSDPEAMEYTQIIAQEQIDPLIRTQNIAINSLYDSSQGVDVGSMLNGNVILTGRITQLEWSDPRTMFQTVTRVADVQATPQDLAENPELQEGDLLSVTAEVTYYRQISSAAIRVNYKMIDVETGVVLFSDMFNREEKSEARWASYSGDSRALTSQDSQAVNVWKKDSDSSRKLVQKIAEEVGESIAEELSVFLR